MEQLLTFAIVGNVPANGGWGSLCGYWPWGFWLGVIVGIIGGAALFLAKPGDGL